MTAPEIQPRYDFPDEGGLSLQCPYCMHTNNVVAWDGDDVKCSNTACGKICIVRVKVWLDGAEEEDP